MKFSATIVSHSQRLCKVNKYLILAGRVGDPLVVGADGLVVELLRGGRRQSRPLQEIPLRHDAVELLYTCKTEYSAYQIV